MGLQAVRISANPVLAKGGTYNGWKADGLAAPGACWDGTRYVMTVSAWSIANSQWASLFFTSPDLATWTYVSGSLRAPQGSDYILGNGDVDWFGGKYYFVYNHYPSAGTPVIALQTSTDLLTWATVADPLYSNYADPALASGLTGNLELWMKSVSTKDIYFASSPDGSAWTNNGAYLASSLVPAAYGGGTDFGEGHAFNYNGVRYLTSDCAGEVGRMRLLWRNAALDTASWVVQSTFLGESPVNAWEGVQVFDGQIVGVFDRGDGRGAKPWLLYAGGDNSSTTDNTDSSIGLAYITLP